MAVEELPEEGLVVGVVQKEQDGQLEELVDLLHERRGEELTPRAEFLPQLDSLELIRPHPPVIPREQHLLPSTDFQR